MQATEKVLPKRVTAPNCKIVIQNQRALTEKALISSSTLRFGRRLKHLVKKDMFFESKVPISNLKWFDKLNKLIRLRNMLRFKLCIRKTISRLRRACNIKVFPLRISTRPVKNYLPNQIHLTHLNSCKNPFILRGSTWSNPIYLIWFSWFKVRHTGRKTGGYVKEIESFENPFIIKKNAKFKL